MKIENHNQDMLLTCHSLIQCFGISCRNFLKSLIFTNLTWYCQRMTRLTQLRGKVRSSNMTASPGNDAKAGKKI